MPTCGVLAKISTTAVIQQWGWAGRGRRYAGPSYPALRGANQLVNAAGVLAAFEALRDKVPVTPRPRTAAMVELPGRFQFCPASRSWCWMWHTTRTRGGAWRPI